MFDVREKGEPKALPASTAFTADNRLSPQEFWGNTKTLFRSACIGTGVGILPGLGVSLAAFLGYGAAKRASKVPEEFGKESLLSLSCFIEVFSNHKVLDPIGSASIKTHCKL